MWRAQAASPAVSHSLVSTKRDLVEFLRVVEMVAAWALSGASPYLFMDVEGNNVCREGTISLVNIFVQPCNHVYMIDVHTLGLTAFTTGTTGTTDTTDNTTGGTSLKSILENENVIKVCFDVRNLSDALFSHYQVALGGIEDLQLMENASRPGGQNIYLNGLGRCIELHSSLSTSPNEWQQWVKLKKYGARFIRYKVFGQRPMATCAVAYCINDVRWLPELRERYWGQLIGHGRKKVIDESRKRVQESFTPEYEPHNRNKLFGPWGQRGRFVGDAARGVVGWSYGPPSSDHYGGLRG